MDKYLQRDSASNHTNSKSLKGNQVMSYSGSGSPQCRDITMFDDHTEYDTACGLDKSSSEDLSRRVQRLTEDFFDSTASLETNKMKTDELLNHVKLLTAIVIKQDKTIGLLRNDIVDLKQRSMKDNTLVHNPHGKKGKIRNFFP